MADHFSLLPKPLKIALIAPPEETVPPQKYGGTELVVSYLADELTRRGHDVSLLTVAGSKSLAKIVEIFEQPLRLNAAIASDPKLREAYKYVTQGQILRYLQHHSFDLIHNHASWRFLPFAPIAGAPVVTTHHGPLGDSYYIKVFEMYGKSSPLISITNAQRKGAGQLNYLATVYNGINTDDFTFNAHPQEYLAYLARFAPEKGPTQAIQIAKKLGKRLLIGAKIDPVDQAFYDKEVAPHIDGKQIVYLGELGLKEKVELLKNAQALLAPIQWDEPFGLYFIEAMACGTPVLAINRGSAPEVIEHGVGGLLGKNEEDLVKLYPNIESLDRAAIRRRTEEKFSIKANVDAHERAYAKLLGITVEEK